MQDIYQNIKERVAQETSDPSVLLNEIKNLGLYMFAMRTLNSDMVESFCAKLISLYQQLNNKGAG